jgi:hypothetical protein
VVEVRQLRADDVPVLIQPLLECSPFVTRLEVWVQFVWVIHLHQRVTPLLAARPVWLAGQELLMFQKFSCCPVAFPSSPT